MQPFRVFVYSRVEDKLYRIITLTVKLPKYTPLELTELGRHHLLFKGSDIEAVLIKFYETLK